MITVPTTNNSDIFNYDFYWWQPSKNKIIDGIKDECCEKYKKKKEKRCKNCPNQT